MAFSLFSPAYPTLKTPTEGRRVLRRPDMRDLVVPRLSGAPLTGGEVDYDDLVIHRTWRSYNEKEPDQVKYFMFELSQRNPGESKFSPVWYKAVRMVRLTRVPRYLRQANTLSGPNMVFEQMRDVLAALREQGVLFTNMIVKSPQLPLVFAYGVQGIGPSPSAAQQMADEAYAVLELQLNGTYQQLMYKPINVAEGEIIARYQAEWRHLAVARGRPIPASSTVGAASLLDGNRTDVEGAQNQLESFIRGMSDRSFMLNLVTVPLTPAEITVAWRNITQKLSELRSETTGMRAVNAGVAFPLAMGTSQGDSHGNTHTSGATYGSSAADSTNESFSQGVTATEGVTNTQGVSTSQSFTNTQGITGTEGVTGTVGVTETQGVNQSVSLGESTTVTDSYNVGQSSSVSTSESHGLNTSQGVSSTASVSESSSVAVGSSVGSNWSNSVGQSINASSTETDSWTQSQANSASQTVTAGNTQGDSSAAGSTFQNGSGINGGIPGVLSGGTNTMDGSNLTNGVSNQDSVAIAQSGGATNTVGVSSSNSNTVSQGVSFGESYGGSTSTSATNSNSVSQAQAVGVNQGVGSSHGYSSTQTATASASQGQSLAQSSSLTTSAGTSASTAQSQSLAQSASTAQSMTASQSATSGQSSSTAQSSSLAQSSTASEGSSRTVGTNQAYNDAYAVALSRTQTASGSLAVAPTFGVSVGKNTLDAAKQYIGDLLEAQQRRYDEGIKSGAFLYQMFLVCPDRETAVGGAGLLKSAFWGSGSHNDKLPQPFHTIVDFDEDEKNRILTHSAAFTSYRKREPVMELIEPFKYSTYLTPTEAATFTHPPVVEGPGLLAVHDSMPVFRIPMDKQNKEITVGRVINGERGLVSDIKFGLDLSEFTHTLIAGVTGSGKTTTLMKMLADAVQIEREIVEPPTLERPYPQTRKAHASIIGLDWMRNMRNLASIPGLASSGRFKFYSLLNPSLGAFKWNPLAVPDDGMSAGEWLNAQADNFTASFNLGEFGRSLIAEFLTDLYSANRLEEFSIRPEVIDEESGVVLRPAVKLPAIDRNQIPESGIQVGPDGKEYANAFTYSPLSRCVSMGHLATLVAHRIEQAADPAAGRLMGTEIRNRLQSLWRRISYFAPGGQYSDMLTCDKDLSTKTCIGVTDLIDPDKGLVTILETDGLDFEARRLILGSVMLAIYRYGLFHGNGVFDQNGKGPGCFVVMEESHELFGESGNNEDAYSAATRTHLYESMFRRVRSLGLRLVAVAQQPSSLPDAVTANISTVFLHKVRADEDRSKAFDLLNMSNQISQQQREFRYLGEMPVGCSLVRLDAKVDYIESAAVHVYTEEPLLEEVSDAALKTLATYAQIL